MKVSYNWLKELLPDLQQSPEEVAELLTLHSFETEVVEKWSIDENIRIVKIIKIEPHPNADRLRLATVTDGEQEVRVVCGAPNIQEGDIVPYSSPGVTVVDQEGNPFVIKEAKIRGEKSPGMLNSLRELGLGTDHSGIFVLPPDTPLGTAFVEHLPNDVILEADITPNRAHDCLSHVGVARELAALLRIAIHEPQHAALPETQETVGGVALNIEDERVLRYAAIVLSDAKPSISPLWLQARLLAVGARPINAIVDITNYVMFELGNPSHAFDASKLEGKTMGVRAVQKEERVMLLDGKSPELPEDTLLITNDNVPVALAGIMGGQGTEVDEATENIILEVANFQAYTIQKTSTTLGLRTEASIRFAKRITPNLVGISAGRLAHLFKEITGARMDGLLDYYPHPPEEKYISFTPVRVNRVAGVEFSLQDMQDILERLRFTVKDIHEVWQVTASYDRLDIEGEHDIIEEIIRVMGLAAIPARIPEEGMAPAELPKETYWREALRDLLVELGMTETYNYSFEPEDMAQVLELTKKDHLHIANPIAPEQSTLRVSLLPGLLANSKSNRSDFHKKFTQQEKALFEIGAVFTPGGKGRVEGVEEHMMVAGMMVGREDDIHNRIEEILRRLHIEGVSFEDVPPSSVWMSGAKKLIFAGKHLGIYGRLSRTVLEHIKYAMPVSAFELDMAALVSAAPEEPRKTYSLEEIQNTPVETVQFSEFSRYPSVLRDISLLVDPSVSAAQIEELIERVGGELLVNTELFDEYLPADGQQKGLAFHIEYQAKDRTLTDKEVNEIHANIILALEKDLSAQIR